MELTYWWLPLLIIVSLTLGYLFYLFIKRKKNKHPSPENTRFVANSYRIYRNRIYLNAVKKMTNKLAIGLVLIIIMILTTLLLTARPVQRTVEKPVNRNRDIVLCMDISGSMLSANAQVSKVFSKMSLGLKGERIGLVAFDSTPVVVFPLTDDYGFISEKLKFLEKVFDYDSNFDFSSDAVYDSSLSISGVLRGAIEGSGSSIIGDGLVGCINTFDNIDSRRSRSIVLVTDNQLAGDYLISILEAGALAKSKGIRVYGINPSDFSFTSYDGSTIHTDEVAEFRQLTINTGGNYYPLDSASAVPGVISLIESQETARIEGSPQVIYTDKPGLFIVVVALSVIGIYLLSWRLRL